jgi:hypothetical protein
MKTRTSDWEDVPERAAAICAENVSVYEAGSGAHELADDVLPLRRVMWPKTCSEEGESVHGVQMK